MSHNTSIYKSNNFFKNKTLVSNRNNIAIIIPIIIGHDFDQDLGCHIQLIISLNPTKIVANNDWYSRLKSYFFKFIRFADRRIYMIYIFLL